MSKSIRIEDDLYEKIEEFALREDRLVTNALVRLIKLGLGLSEPSEKKEVETPKMAGSQAKNQPNDNIGRREVKSVPQLIEEINLIKTRYSEEAEFCQDVEGLKNLNKRMAAEIQPLQAQIDSMV